MWFLRASQVDAGERPAAVRKRGSGYRSGTIVVSQSSGRIPRLLLGAASRPADDSDLFALTLRGPSGGHCVELQGGAGVKGPRRAHEVTLSLPGSPTQWPSEGPRRVSADRSRRWSVLRTSTTPSVHCGWRLVQAASGDQEGCGRALSLLRLPRLALSYWPHPVSTNIF